MFVRAPSCPTIPSSLPPVHLLLDKTCLDQTRQPLGVVVAETEAAAREAARLVQVQYEDLPPVYSIHDAINAGSFFEARRLLSGGVGIMCLLSVSFWCVCIQFYAYRSVQGVTLREGCLRLGVLCSRHRPCAASAAWAAHLLGQLTRPDLPTPTPSTSPKAPAQTFLRNLLRHKFA